MSYADHIFSDRAGEMECSGYSHRHFLHCGVCTHGVCQGVLLALQAGMRVMMSEVSSAQPCPHTVTDVCAVQLCILRRRSRYAILRIFADLA
jgi:hypothetical protein